MPAVIPQPSMMYEGSEANRVAADLFAQQIAADPSTMAVVLRGIARSPLDQPYQPDFSHVPEARREARVAAHAAAAAFLDLGPDSGQWDFDRPTERAISNDQLVGDLRRMHRATANSPDRQSEVTRRIRAQHLAIFAGRTASAQAALARQ